MSADARRNGGLVWISSHIGSLRWSERTGQQRRDLREVWWEAEPIDYPDAIGPSTVARYHEPTGQVLLAANGKLMTCIPLSNRPRDVQDAVRNQVSNE